MRSLFILLTTTLMVCGVLIIGKGFHYVSTLKVPGTQLGAIGQIFNPATMLFTGDIMLARSVEQTIDEKTFPYLFANITTLLGSHDVVVGNFEGSVPAVHKQTPSGGMRFSVREEFLPPLRDAGFDILSLANNHSFDNGADGYEHTIGACTNVGLVCVGNPNAVSTSSLYTTQIGDSTVGVMFVHTLYGFPNAETIAALSNKLRDESDVQIAYIHWGDEYERTHNAEQEAFAHLLIDAGFDAIIGHHPHVIQDVERYHGKPIFYSLGNLIFDQYFSDDVQHGYLVSLALQKKTLTYSLIPYETMTNRSQPRLFESAQRAELFDVILPQSQFTQDEIKAGSFAILRD